PTILWLSQKPKYPQTSVPHATRMDAYQTIAQPLNTERTMKKIKDNNHLLFIVDNKVCQDKVLEITILDSSMVMCPAQWEEQLRFEWDVKYDRKNCATLV
ncbi:hypothetical protein BY996DRAFT_4600766, partial [Phakopsora pachyrhizi]